METLPTRPRKHFSMIRAFHLADVFTLANAACGVAAIGMAMRALTTHRVEDLLVAAAFAPAPMGRELDSLADVISFGVAPAARAFACGATGGWDALILVYFVCCGVSRLARYNVTAETLSEGGDKVKYFEGTPIPTSVLLTAVLAWAAWQGRIGADLPGGAWTLLGADLHPFALLFALSGTLMVSKTLRIPKL